MKFLPILLLLTLAACGGTVTTNAVVQPNAPVTLPVAQPLTLNNVQWQVMSVAQLQALIATLQKAQQQNQVVFVLDTQDYTNLQLNFVEIERYIKDQKAILTEAQQIFAQRAGQTVASPTKPVK